MTYCHEVHYIARRGGDMGCFSKQDYGYGLLFDTDWLVVTIHHVMLTVRHAAENHVLVDMRIHNFKDERIHVSYPRGTKRQT